MHQSGKSSRGGSLRGVTIERQPRHRRAPAGPLRADFRFFSPFCGLLFPSGRVRMGDLARLVGGLRRDTLAPSPAAAQESDAHVRPERQSDRGQAFRSHSRPPEENRRAARSPGVGGLRLSAASSGALGRAPRRSLQGLVMSVHDQRIAPDQPEHHLHGRRDFRVTALV